MSHYAVAVFTKEGTSYEDLLKPYDESLPVPHYIAKSEIIKNVKDEIEQYKNGTYAKYLNDPKEYIDNCNNEAHIKYITEEFPKRLTWTDEECYQYGIEVYDKENIQSDGSVFETYNRIQNGIGIP